MGTLTNLRNEYLDKTYDEDLKPLGPVEGEEEYTGPPFIPLDSEGDGYDYRPAEAAGLSADETGHWPRQSPRTGQALKEQGHPTYHITTQGEGEEENTGYGAMQARALFATVTAGSKRWGERAPQRETKRTQQAAEDAAFEASLPEGVEELTMEHIYAMKQGGKTDEYFIGKDKAEQYYYQMGGKPTSRVAPGVKQALFNTITTGRPPLTGREAVDKAYSAGDFADFFTGGVVPLGDLGRAIEGLATENKELLMMAAVGAIPIFGTAAARSPVVRGGIEKVAQRMVPDSSLSHAAKSPFKAREMLWNAKGPEFRASFGETVARDEAGYPLVVFHGQTQGTDLDHLIPSTRDRQTVFGQGVYTTPSVDVANSYARSSPTASASGRVQLNKGPHDGAVVPMFVNIRKPLYSKSEFPPEVQKDLLDYLTNNSKEYAALRQSPRLRRAFPRNNWESLMNTFFLGSEGAPLKKGLQDILAKHGYDGVIVGTEEAFLKAAKTGIFTKKHHIIPFSNTQLKSVFDRHFVMNGKLRD